MRTQQSLSSAFAFLAAFAAGAAALLGSSVASACPNFAGDIQTDLGLSYTPLCTICHTTEAGGTGTVTKAFGIAMKANGLSPCSDSSVQTALNALEKQNHSSAGDGISDITKLKEGLDPNLSGPAVEVPLPPVAYGCAATMAKSDVAGGGAAVAVVAMLGASFAFRRRLSPSRSPGARRKGGRARRARAIAAGAGAGAVVLTGSACFDASFVSTSACKTGVAWTGGDTDGSPYMNPGFECMQCHGVTAHPDFQFAGTVYAVAGESDDCFGEKGVKVTIIGADGKKIALTSNDSGNFYSGSSVTLPFTATVEIGGNTMTMTTPQVNGDCNYCHAKAGLNGATGRILAP